MRELNYFFRTYPIKNAEGDNIRKHNAFLIRILFKITVGYVEDLS